MAEQELPGSFGALFPMKAERSRNKERLEASLAGLCELELLKQRQECRVLSALCLGDCLTPPWGALRSACCALDTMRANGKDESGRRLQTSSLQSTAWGIKATLEEQVAELNVNTEVQTVDYSPDMVNSLLTSGEVLVAKQSRSPDLPLDYHSAVSRSGPDGTGETQIEKKWMSDLTRRTSVADALGEEDYRDVLKLETYIFGIIQRKVLPIRPSKPRTSVTHDIRAVTVVRQSSLCRKEEQHSSKQISIQDISTLSQCTEGTAQQVCHNRGQERNPETGFIECGQSPYHHHPQQGVQPWLCHRPRQASMINASRSTLLECQSLRVLQAQPDSSNSEPDSPQHTAYPAPPVLSKPQQPPLSDEQLVNAEYIPAQPCQASTRAYAHHHSNPHKGSGMPKPNRRTYSPERSHHHHLNQEQQQPTASQIQPLKSRGGQKKCRSSEDRSSASRKPGKKACRSQSENSLQRVPERKYNTVERDGGGSGSGGRGSRSSQSRSKKQHQGSGSYRRWQSSLDLSQDEAEQPSMQAPSQGSSASNHRDQCGKRTRKSRPTHASYAYPPHHQSHHHHQHMEYQVEREQVPVGQQPSGDYPHPGQAESESSMSEADSPDSSSLSSDSDESGGLVWPQQLPPQLSVPSSAASPGTPLQPKAFVKIKASHALKKKILRFRTGSLKVMTTV